LAGHQVTKVDSITGSFVEEQVASMQEGDVMLLENVRFDSREEQNSDAMALELSKLADVYINDAFSVCHRAHTSTGAITKYLPSYAGLLLTEEIRVLSNVLHNPKHPAVAIVGGAKISTKLPVIEALRKQFDYVLVGGKIANEYLDTYGESQMPNVIFPTDFANSERYDIGPKTIEQFSNYIEKAKTVMWNGPMGFVERKPYDKGTFAVATAIANNPDVYSVIGGGETVDEVYQLHKENKIDFISTGGGAMLTFISAEGDLPALKALE
jgi:phosphoglycerate kinase